MAMLQNKSLSEILELSKFACVGEEVRLAVYFDYEVVVWQVQVDEKLLVNPVLSYYF